MPIIHSTVLNLKTRIATQESRGFKKTTRYIFHEPESEVNLYSYEVVCGSSQSDRLCMVDFGVM